LVPETSKKKIEKNADNGDDDDDNDDSSSCDLRLCMTHQGIAENRDMAKEFGGGQFPLLMGGHDHESYLEEVNGSQIIKTGMNAQKAAIIDIH
jgi:hypothetical protein